MANIDKLYPVIIKDPYGFLVFLVKQYGSNFVQNSLFLLINSFINNNSYIKKWKKYIWKRFKSQILNNCVIGLQYTTISIGLSSIRSYICDKKNDRSYFDFCYDISENIIQNNLDLIHTFLTNNWIIWKSATGYATSFVVWLPQFISTNIGRTTVGKIIGYVLTPFCVFEAGPIVSGIATIACARLIKQLIFNAPSELPRLAEGIVNAFRYMNKSVHQRIMDEDDDQSGGGCFELDSNQRDSIEKDLQNLEKKEDKNLEDNMRILEYKGYLTDHSNSYSLSQLTIGYKIPEQAINKTDTISSFSREKLIKNVDCKVNNKAINLTVNRKPIKLTVNRNPIKVTVKKPGSSVISDCKKTENIPNLINYSKLDDSRQAVESIIKAELMSDVVYASAYYIQKACNNMPPVTSVSRDFEESLISVANIPVARAVPVC